MVTATPRQEADRLPEAPAGEHRQDLGKMERKLRFRPDGRLLKYSLAITALFTGLIAAAEKRGHDLPLPVPQLAALANQNDHFADTTLRNMLPEFLIGGIPGVEVPQNIVTSYSYVGREKTVTIDVATGKMVETPVRGFVRFSENGEIIHKKLTGEEIHLLENVFDGSITPDQKNALATQAIWVQVVGRLNSDGTTTVLRFGFDASVFNELSVWDQTFSITKYASNTSYLASLPKDEMPAFLPNLTSEHEKDLYDHFMAFFYRVSANKDKGISQTDGEGEMEF